MVAGVPERSCQLRQPVRQPGAAVGAGVSYLAKPPQQDHDNGIGEAVA